MSDIACPEFSEKYSTNALWYSTRHFLHPILLIRKTCGRASFFKNAEPRAIICASGGSGRRSEKLNAELIKLAVTACLWLFMAKTIYNVKKFERHCFSVKVRFQYLIAPQKRFLPDGEKSFCLLHCLQRCTFLSEQHPSCLLLRAETARLTQKRENEFQRIRKALPSHEPLFLCIAILEFATAKYHLFRMFLYHFYFL